jgi:hypothetical protein
LHPTYDVGVAPRGSSSASVHDVKSYIESLGALKNIVIRNSYRCKEMTTMTMFLGGQRGPSVRKEDEAARRWSGTSIASFWMAVGCQIDDTPFLHPGEIR